MRDSVADYDEHGDDYRFHRQTDPEIMAYIETELGDAQTVLNVGAGTGSYEPTDRYVISIEPSATMRRQRPGYLCPAMIGTAASIPFDDGAFHAATAILTIHHWPNLDQCLREVRRVTAGPLIIMTFDPFADTEFWLRDYLPEMTAVERARYPSLDVVRESVGGNCKTIAIPVPLNCPDKFQVALYGRPEEFLNNEVRKSQSAWTFLPDGCEHRFVSELSRDIESGLWDQKYGRFRTQPNINCQLRLVVSSPHRA